MQLKTPALPPGFALLEVLVAMLLAAVAVLALASVHVAALHATRSNLHRTAAAQLAMDLGERMRANRAAALLGVGSPYQVNTSWDAGPLVATDPVASLCDGPGAACSPVDLARADVAQWQLLLRGALPAGAVQVQLDAAQALADIRIGWREVLATATDELPANAADCPAAVAAGAGALRCLRERLAW